MELKSSIKQIENVKYEISTKTNLDSERFLKYIVFKKQKKIVNVITLIMHSTFTLSEIKCEYIGFASISH